jgi:hypothetical protein
MVAEFELKPTAEYADKNGPDKNLTTTNRAVQESSLSFVVNPLLSAQSAVDLV